MKRRNSLKQSAWMTAVVLGLWVNLAGASHTTSTALVVQSQKKPGQPWIDYPTRAIDHLAGFQPGAFKMSRDRYGGWAEKKAEARGFFYPKQIDGRWWLIDPQGCAFIHVGVCAVSPGRTPTMTAALREKFGSPAKWADHATRQLKQYGFNGAGGWSTQTLLRSAPVPLVYTCSWNFMSSFGKEKKLTHQQPGHTGYVNDCIPVFHPEFETFCDSYAQQLAPTKNDPWLLGHFSDNEMPCPKDLLDRHLKLDPSDPRLAPGYRAAREWLTKRTGPNAAAAAITDEDREAFRAYVFGRYFEITTRAMRKHDPNHLMLGSRLYGAEKQSPALFGAAGKHLDVIAVNYYGAWTPDVTLLRNWAQWSGKPVIITEFYTKGADSGYPNTTGAGWVVPTQRDRGLFYHNYVLALLESGACVGWHWFKYMDNDPADKSADPSNLDSNKGIVTIRFDEYKPLLDEMKRVNDEVYAAADWFDSEKGKGR